MQRVLADSSWRLRLVLTDQDGNALDASAVTATITDSAGIEIPGSPFDADEVQGEQGDPETWEVTLPATATGILDVYDVDWTCTVGVGEEHRSSSYEVVGGFLFEIGELRALDPQLADPGNPTAQVLRQARDAAEDLFDTRTRPSFRRRARRHVCDGTGNELLILPDLYPRRLVSVLVDGVALVDFDDIVLYDAGILRRPAGWPRGRRNVEVFYEHGRDAVPGPVHTAALKLARSFLVRSPIPDRATTQTTEAGTFRVAVAGRDGPTGIPDVDAVLGELAAEIVVA